MSDEKPVVDHEFVPGLGLVAYPALTPTERRILRVVSKKLYVSRRSLEWAYFESVYQGNDERFKRLARRIAKHPPLTVMIDDSEEQA